MGHGGAAERAGSYLVPRAAGEPGARRGHALPLPVEGLLPMPPGPGRLPRERRQPEARWERRALRGAGGMRSVPRALPLFSSFTVLHPGRLMAWLEGAGLAQTGRQPLPLGRAPSALSHRTFLTRLWLGCVGC